MNEETRVRAESAARLESERLRLGFRTQTALCRAIGISTSALSTYEKGTRPIDGDFLAAFAKLGADTNYIFTGLHDVREKVYPAVQEAVALLDLEVDAKILAGLVVNLCDRITVNASLERASKYAISTNKGQVGDNMINNFNKGRGKK